MEKKEYKHILDSVHGNIYIDKDLVTNIVDTPAFQRLRRIEQTSTRAIFPSARHDRFIHSLGVYHIGCLMTKQLKQVVADSNDLKGYANHVDNFSECFKIACLLHDIGHSPFSHTFEKYFGEEISDHKNDGKQNLREDLFAELTKKNTTKKRLLTTQELYSKRNNTNFHELTSAIITVKSFAHLFPIGEYSKYDNLEFIIRMIIGCKYYYKKDDVDLQLRNCFIDLLHGGIIDADRLDYACRDVWASGYRTSSVDIQRLIAGLYIEKNTKNKGEYVVCFKSNVLNEIQSVLDVKDFQVQYVLNHHTVILEQHFLEQAALNMANDICSFSNNSTPLYEILKWEALTGEGVEIQTIKYKDKPISLKYICDDDMIFLMKLSNNGYYQQWEKRQFGYKALWKTRDQFFYYFDIPRISIEENVKDLLKKKLLESNPSLSEDDILIKKVKYKSRIGLDDLHIYMSQNNVVDYKSLYRESDIFPNDETKKGDMTFYYFYIKENALQNMCIQDIIDNLKLPIKQEYKRKKTSLEKKNMYKREILKVIEKMLN